MSGRVPIPDLVIGGAPRSGTTFLCELLAKHPSVHIARPFIPEPKVCMTPHPDGDTGLLARYAGYFSQASGSAVRIEKTSYYLENAGARERLARLLPEAKFVFILREPVARAYSNWSRTRAQGLETLPFEQAVTLEGNRPNPLPDRAYARPFDYMARGRYGTLAEEWIEAVGRSRVAFYIFEAALAGPEAFVAHLQAFAGLEPLPWSKLSTGRVNTSEDDAGEIGATLAIELRRRIGPEMTRLAQVTGLDVSIWGY